MHQLPDMTIGILEAVTVHETVVLWLSMRLAAILHCQANHLIDLLPASAAQTIEHLSWLVSVNIGLLVNPAKKGLISSMTRMLSATTTQAARR
jgi:uncharacterized protein involved in cysteine biosynthesis